VEAEEAMLYVPIGDEGFALLEQLGDPSVADMGIERGVHVVNHPEHRDATPCLAEMVALAGIVHLVFRQFPGGDERLEGIETVGAAGIDHRPGGQHEIDLFPDFGADPFPELLKGVAKDFIPCHRLARVIINY